MLTIIKIAWNKYFKNVSVYISKYNKFIKITEIVLIISFIINTHLKESTMKLIIANYVDIFNFKAVFLLYYFSIKIG